MPEKRQFQMDPHLLYSTIMAQAGTITKALQEAVQNSIDAGASFVNIALDDHSFRVEDDGNGFASREDIERFFETFGTPHTEGDAKYGKFRMGRGQLFAFGENSWRSNTFQMDVNIKKKGLHYDLHEHLPKVAGCSVGVALYDPLPLTEQMQVIRDLKKLVAYSEIPVRVNGRVISENPATLKGFEDIGDAYYKPSTGRLTVYNMGMLVREYGTEQFGVGGIVVSKSALQVNFARNDILLSQCSTWKGIRKILIERGGKQVAKKRASLTDEERVFVINDLLSSDPKKTYEEMISIKKMPLLVMANGRRLSLQNWESALRAQYTGEVTTHTYSDYTIAPYGQAIKAEQMIAERHLAFKESTPSEWNTSPEELGARLASFCSLNPIPYKPFDSLAAHIDSDLRSYPEEKLEDRARLLLKRLRYHNKKHSLGAGKSRHKTRRFLMVGTGGAEAWTDGETTITINHKLLTRAAKDPDELSALVHILAHEYTHDGSSMGDHVHGVEFYQDYHDCTINPSFSHRLRLLMEDFYTKVLPEHDLLPSVGRSIIDIMAVTQKIAPSDAQEAAAESGEDEDEDEDESAHPR